MRMKDTTNRLAALLKSEKLHGHTKIILRDISGGEKVIEKDNLVTNALYDLFKCDYDGLLNVPALLPLRKLFGGIYCFHDPITENAGAYYPPCESANALTAHAGQDSHSTASPYRGNPNGALSQEITGGYRFVYDFSTSQGNGTISAVCMTSSNAGDVGLIPYDTSVSLIDRNAAFQITDVNFIAPTQTINADYAVKHPFKIDAENGTAVAVFISGGTFMEFQIEHHFTKFGLNLTATDWKVVSVRTASLTRTFGSNTTFAEDDDYYYVMQNPLNGGASLLCDKVSKATMTAVDNSLTLTGAALKAVTMPTGVMWPRFPYGVEEGLGDVYVYWPTTTGSFARINLNNQADLEVLQTALSTWDDINLNRGFARINERLYVGDKYIINGSDVYETAGVTEIDTETQKTTIPLGFARNNGTVCAWCNNYLASSAPSWRRLIGPTLIYPYLATINNLNSSVTKSASQTMQIQYDITAV